MEELGKMANSEDACCTGEVEKHEKKMEDNGTEQDELKEKKRELKSSARRG
jgi:hypothetical protein